MTNKELPAAEYIENKITTAVFELFKDNIDLLTKENIHIGMLANILGRASTLITYNFIPEHLDTKSKFECHELLLHALMTGIKDSIARFVDIENTLVKEPLASSETKAVSKPH